jgi:N4-gp56 family major capsid protein
MSWKFDAPSGTYRNHALSTDIRRQAIANTQFMPFARNEPGYGRKRGESVTIVRTLALPLAGRVNETDRLPSGRAAVETKQVSVSQWGFKIPMTELEVDLTHFDMEEVQRAAMRDQIQLTMDKMVADALKQAPNKYVPQSTGGTFTTNGVFAGTSDRNLGIQDLRRIHDELAGTLRTPFHRDGKYIGILSTRAARGIKNDPEYKDWQAPTTSGPLIDGRLRDVEGFILIETNHFDALANLVGASTTTGEAIFFGADAVGLVTVRDPEIRMGVPDELGTHFEIGWVGTLESFLVWERAEAGLARVIHVGST